MRTDKRFWTHVAAGTAAVIAVVFGVKQCSDKQGANRTAEAVKTELVVADSLIARADRHIDGLNHKLDSLSDENAALRDTIAVRDEKIADLRDSLAICQDGKVDCGCKKKTTPAKPATKPATKPAPAKPAKVVDAKPAVFVTKDTVIVSAGAPVPDQGVIVNGDNNGQIIINANGIVNANDNVNGHDNNVNSDDTARKQRELLEQYANRTVVVKKVRCR